MPRSETTLAMLLGILLWSVSSSRASAQPAPESNATESAPVQTEAPRAPHPEPRVIVSVHSVRGPHVRKDVERAARLGWGKIVGCYKAASPKRTRGAVSMELVVTGGGKVTSARRTKSTFAGPLTRCLTRAMRAVPMPTAARKSTVGLEVQVGPGDADG